MLIEETGLDNVVDAEKAYVQGSLPLMDGIETQQMLYRQVLLVCKSTVLRCMNLHQMQVYRSHTVSVSVTPSDVVHVSNQ